MTSSEGQQPHIVRARGAALWSWVIVFSASTLVSLFGTFYFAQTPERGDSMLAAGCLGLAVFFVLGVWALFRPAYVLYPDRIVENGGLGRRELYRSQIKGLEVLESDGGGVVLIPITPGASKMIVAANWLKDPVLSDWLDDIRNLTAEAFAQTEAEILADTAYGEDQTERERSLVVARRICQGLTCAAIGAFLWGMVMPRPYHLVLGLATAVSLAAAISVWISKGLIVWMSSHASARPSAGYAAVSGCLIVGLRTFLDLDVIDWPKLVAGALVLAVIGGFIIRPKTEKDERFKLINVLQAAGALFALFYGWGGQANLQLDNSPARVFPLTVSAKHTSGSRPMLYELSVPAWDDRPASDLSVAPELYNKVKVGDRICVYEHTGALGLRYFQTDRCD